MEFRRDAWQQRTFVISPDPRSVPIDSLLTAEDVDDLLSSVDFPASNLDLANGSQPLSKDAYAPVGIIDIGRVLGLHRDGATIILRAAHRWSGKLRRLCSRLEWDFGFPVQANIYLTPAGCKSTPPHWDTHDLFIVQVAGTKLWKLFASDYGLPLDSQRFSEETFSIGPLVEEIELNAGQVLYLPRGTIHEPVADSYSIHISLGLLVTRWADLLLDLVEAAAEDRRELRSAVEIHTGQLDSVAEGEIVQRLLELVELLRDQTNCESAVRRHIISLLSRHGDHREHQILGVIRCTKVSHSSPMRRTPSAYLWVGSKAERVEVHWKRGRFSVPSQYAPFIDAILSGEPFTLEDAPQYGDEDQRLALCEALVEQGLLEVLTK